MKRPMDKSRPNIGHPGQVSKIFATVLFPFHLMVIDLPHQAGFICSTFIATVKPALGRKVPQDPALPVWVS